MEKMIIGRMLFSFCLFLSWFISIIHIIQAKEMIYVRGVQKSFAIHTQKKLILPSIFYFCFVIGFALEFYEQLTGWGIIALIYWVRHWEKSLWRNNTVSDLGKYSASGTGLIGYLIGLLLAPLFQLSGQQMGVDIASGMIACAWFLSGWNKLKLSGLRWISAHNIGLMMAERAYIGHTILRQLRLHILNSNILLWLIGFMGIFLELLGLIFCIPELRMTYAITINILLIYNIFIMGYFEPEWQLSIIALSLMTTL